MGVWDNLEYRNAYYRRRYNDPNDPYRARKKAYCKKDYKKHRAKRIETIERWQEANPAKVKQYSRRGMRTNRHRYRLFVQSFKKAPCLDCKMSYPHYVMDFDHVRGEKHFEIATAMNGHAKLDVIRQEIDKCDLVCANCHRERTNKRQKPLLTADDE